MRVPIYLTPLLLISLAVIGWRNHLHTRELRDQQEKLVSRARADGWMVDQRAPGVAVKPARNRRPDPMAIANEAATALVSYARELPFPDDYPADLKRRRILLESERVQSLSGKQLKVVIEELRAATEIEDGVRASLLVFTLERLSKSHPQDALEISIAVKAQSYRGDFAAEIMETWAELDSARAKGWLDANLEVITEEQKAGFERALIAGAVIGDPSLALKWFSDSGSGVSGLIARRDLTPEQRQAFLTALRSWRKTSAGEAFAPDDHAAVLSNLVFGRNDSGDLSLKNVMEFWNNVRLDAEEISALSRIHIASRVNPEECVEFYKWIGRNLPEEAAARWQSTLLYNPSTSQRIQEWLESEKAETVKSRHTDSDSLEVDEPDDTYPVAKAVPGKAGFVFSPYNNRIVDVRGLSSGTMVQDPSMEPGESRTFRVP
ncbi:hypothetical protein HZ994_12825 [Akkermansiaceae bacterium]|nr:hypothetical protein HZ994_12825 [Akkermansiaceae bacterium]